ncbi:glutamate synthase domain-containing protein 2 [Peribacillus sp. V2I11]|nr:glutamate synthase domain-containing protein 2 [Peribacillus sp. V2I11]
MKWWGLKRMRWSLFEHFFENQTLKDIKKLVNDLRSITGGVPIGVKMGAGGKIEEDHFSLF